MTDCIRSVEIQDGEIYFTWPLLTQFMYFVWTAVAPHPSAWSLLDAALNNLQLVLNCFEFLIDKYNLAKLVLYFVCWRVYLYKCEHVNVCVHSLICACVYMCVCRSVCVCLCIDVCVHVCVFAWLSVTFCVWWCMCACVYMYVSVCVNERERE